MRAAIAAGYAKGFRTILDANVGHGDHRAGPLRRRDRASVKGFALMLLIGTVVSLVTAVAATRAMLGLLAGFSGSTTRASWARPRSRCRNSCSSTSCGRRTLWFAISCVVIVVSIVVARVRGLNLGIDFKGGVQVTFTTPKPRRSRPSARRPQAIGHGDAVVQGRGTSTNGGETTRTSRSG